MLHRKGDAASITFQGNILEEDIKEPLEYTPELLPGYVDPTLGSWEDGESSTALAGPFRIMISIFT